MTNLLFDDVAHSAEAEFRDTFTVTSERWVKKECIIPPSSFPSMHLPLSLFPNTHFPFLLAQHTQVKNVYSETVTLFFVHMVDKAIQEVRTNSYIHSTTSFNYRWCISPHSGSSLYYHFQFGGRPHSFEEFLASSPDLMDAQLLVRHYSPNRINSQEARERSVKPDLFPYNIHVVVAWERGCNELACFSPPDRTAIDMVWPWHWSHSPKFEIFFLPHAGG